MTEITRNFVAGVMNKDADERLLPEGQIRDGLNITISSSGSKSIGSIQNAPGNSKIGNLATVTGRTVSNARTIGSISVESINKIYWLVASDFFDGIFELDVKSGNVYRVLQSNKVNSSAISKLNFHQSCIVTGINYISGLLFFTDNRNEPFKVNVERARTYDVDDERIDSDIKVILNAPLFSPYIQISNDGSQSNNMSEKFLYFAYRFKYIDNEYSPLSPFSNSAFAPGPYEFDPQKGYNAAMINKANRASISFETGNKFVKEIQLVMLDSTSKNVFVVDSFDKEKLNIADNTSYTFNDFSNNKTYSSLPSDQIGRMFDNVPLLAATQELVGSRLVYGNYTEFYDIKDSTGTDIKIDFSVSYVSDIVSPTPLLPKPTFRSDRDLELGLIYEDEYGRKSTVLTSLTNTVYINPSNSATSNSLVVDIRNKAPYWAKTWKLAIKQTKGGYYNLFPIVFYKDSNYRWFLLNQSDKDKISEGEYVIFKSNPLGPTKSNKQYKVLEVSQKTGGFVPGAVSGLYFKIKVTDASEFSPNLLFSYSSTGEGVSTTIGNNAEIAPAPLNLQVFQIERPIFYGVGNGAALTVVSHYGPSLPGDKRFTIEMDGPNTFRCTVSLDGSGPYFMSNVTIVPNTNIPVTYNGVAYFSIRFSTISGLIVNDKWKINFRGVVGDVSSSNYFGGIGLRTMALPSSGGYAIIPGASWSPQSTPEVDRQIRVGAIITIWITEDKYYDGGIQLPNQFPPSDRTYENIEEWFVESGAYLQFVQKNNSGSNVGANRISFRRGAFYSEQAGTSPGGDLSNTVQQSYQTPLQTVLSYPIRMFIAGFGAASTGGGNNQNHMVVKFSIQQQENTNIVETVPKDNTLEVFHELSQTFSVDEDGNHLVKWRYDDFIFFQSEGTSNSYTALTQLNPGAPHYFFVGQVITVETTTPGISGERTIIEVPDRHTIVIDVLFPGSGPVTPGTVSQNSIDTDQSGYPYTAKVLINNPNNINSDYNAWTFGDGLESNRIKDDFNRTTLEYSIRASAAIDDYSKKLNSESICWSETFQEDTMYNRLNEFNLSLANFKRLDKSFGAVRKMYSRNTDMIVFQDFKVSTVLYGKNKLVDETGGGQITSVVDVFGTQIPWSYENGIGKTPESFAVWGDDVYFADPNKAAILQIQGNDITEISLFGMKNYFKDMFKSNPDTQKIGVFDPYRKIYTLSSNNLSSTPCNLSISPSSGVYSSSLHTSISLFFVETDSPYTLEFVDTGSGIDWLLLDSKTKVTGTGYVTGTILANGTSTTRSLNIVLTYCGGVTKTFTLTQGRGRKINVINSVFANDVPFVLGSGSTGVVLSNPGKYNHGYSLDGGTTYFETDLTIPSGRTSTGFSLEGVEGVGVIPPPVLSLYMKSSMKGAIGNRALIDSYNNQFGWYLSNETLQSSDLYEVMNRVVSLGGNPPAASIPLDNSDEYAYLYLSVDYVNRIEAGSKAFHSYESGEQQIIDIPTAIEAGVVVIDYEIDALGIRFIIIHNGNIVLDETPTTMTSSLLFTKTDYGIGKTQLFVYNPTIDPIDLDIEFAGTFLLPMFVSDPFDSPDLACGGITTQTLYFNGFGDPGDIIYLDATGENIFDGGNKYYIFSSSPIAVPDPSSVYGAISSKGVLSNTGSCTCSESSEPIINQGDITVIQGQSFSIGVDVDNNPTSWEVVSDCTNYLLSGGDKGAIFNYTDCDSISKDITVGVGSKLTVCASISPTLITGTGTIETDGPCLEKSLPNGVTFNNGIIEGIPENTGVHTIELIATNCVGDSTPASFDIIVQSPYMFTPFGVDVTTPSGNSTAACALTAVYDILYHNGLGEYPQVGDKLFTDPRAVFEFVGGNQWFRMRSDESIQVDPTGVVTDIFTC